MKKIIVSLALLIAATGGTALAQTVDQVAVTRAVSALSKAMINADKRELDKLTADELSYGHSSGRLDTKDVFIADLVSKKSVFKSIDTSKQNVTIVADIAVVRNHFSGATETAGKAANVELEVIMVWHKRGGEWILLARQAYRV